MSHVLIVDDNPDNLEYLRVLLSANACTVETACHGAEALAKARRTPPRVIISDLLMPVMDGYTLLRHWKADARLGAIPFIVYTATYTEAEDEELALRLGADAFILKPTEPDVFVQKMREVCGRKPLPRSGDVQAEDEAGLLKVYSQALIRKLEEKMLQLEQSNQQLQQDIQRREAAETALRKSEAQFRLLTETMPQIVWMARSDGWYLHFNQRWVEYTGLALEQSMGHRWLDALHPDDRERAQQSWKRATSRGESYEVEYRIRRADGSYHWMLGRALPMEETNGSISRWFGTCTDIDDLRRASDALRLSEERFRLLAAATTDAIWDWDMGSGLRWWSEGVQSLFGYPRATLEPDNSSWTSRLHPEDRDAVLAGLQAAIGSATDNWSAHYRFLRSDESFAHVEDRGQIIRDAQGRATRMVGGMTDVSDRVALEEQLRQSQRLESIGQLTGGVAHDFNNMLTVIMGSAEVLSEREDADEELRSLLAMILDASRRGAALTKRLLAFARKQALMPQPVDVNALVASLEPLLRRTLGEHIEIEFACSADLWPALVDPGQLESALLNLSLNARDAMESGGWLTIETQNVDIDQGYLDRHASVRAGQYVAMTVSDTGSGIAPELLGRVFEPFFTTKPEGKGTGLGLAMVYGFLKQSGGHVNVYSEPGQGTSIKLYLPRARSEALPDDLSSQDSDTQGGSESILLVEDDELVRRHVIEQLRALGYRVLEASNAQQALQQLDAGAQVDLLFTDVVMPGLSGRELAEQARVRRTGLKVLFTSGYTQNAMAHHEPAMPLLNKPYRRVELARAVRRALQG